MNPEVEMLASDAGDTCMKFRLGEDLTRVVHQTAKEFDVEEELVLELILFESLYGNFCLRCGHPLPPRRHPATNTRSCSVYGALSSGIEERSGPGCEGRRTHAENERKKNKIISHRRKCTAVFRV